MNTAVERPDLPISSVYAIVYESAYSSSRNVQIEIITLAFTVEQSAQNLHCMPEAATESVDQSDSDRSCFKLSEDGGETFSNILSSYTMSESNEDNIQILREQFANTEARLALLG